MVLLCGTQGLVQSFSEVKDVVKFETILQIFKRHPRNWSVTGSELLLYVCGRACSVGDNQRFITHA